MIQNFSTFKAEVSKLDTIIGDNAQLQKIYTSSYYLCFAVRTPGKTHYAYIGRGKGQEGFWTGDEKLPSHLRKKDQFLEYLRKHLMGTRLLNIKVPFNDRLAVITYQKWGAQNQLVLFYKGRTLEFLHCYKLESGSYQSLSNVFPTINRSDIYEEYELRDLWGDYLKDFSQMKLSDVNIKDLLSEEITIAKTKGESKKKKFLQRKFEKISLDLAKVRKNAEITDKINDYYQSPFKIEDNIFGLKIKFNKDMSDGAKINKVYEKIKKLKRAEPILVERLENTKKELAKKDKGENNLAITQIFSKKLTEAKNTPKQNYKVIDFKNLKIGYGTSATGNDQLRKNWASKTDIWFHINNQTSSHIIIKGLDIQDLTEEHFMKIGEIYNEIANGELSEIDLVCTQVKNLKGVTGVPGSVTVKKAKYRKILLK